MAMISGFVTPQAANGGLNRWTTAGAEGGDIVAVAVDPRTRGVLYAATHRAVFKSTSDGNMWASINAGFTVQGFNVLAVDPQAPTTVYAGMSLFGVFKSTNGGASWSASTLLLSVESPAGCGLSASVSASQASFVVGQTLITSGSVTNPGLPGLAADFYVGVLHPDGSIQFVTPTGIVMGTVTDLQSFRPLAVNVPLTTPFSVSQSSVFTHQWTADDVPGLYRLLLLSTKPGALAGGAITNDQILRVATAPFSFP